MEIICENLTSCGFVKMFEGKNNLAVKGFVLQYCKSEKMIECKRMEYIEKFGTPPPNNMLPNGAIFHE